MERARLERTVEQERRAAAEKLALLEETREKLERTLGERTTALEGEVATLRAQLAAETETRISAGARADRVPGLMERIASLQASGRNLPRPTGRSGSSRRDSSGRSTRPPGA